jgi:hypothetical protein
VSEFLTHRYGWSWPDKASRIRKRLYGFEKVLADGAKPRVEKLYTSSSQSRSNTLKSHRLLGCGTKYALGISFA